MLSPETIEKIQKLSEAQQKSLLDQVDSKFLLADLAVQAEGVSLVNLERYKEHRDNMRGDYSTDSIKEFHDFTKAQLEHFESFPVFVDGPNMKAEAIIDYGTAKTPGHCRFTAEIGLQRTALFKALCSKIHECTFGQRDLAELLEEYQAHVTVYVEGKEGKEAASLPKALAAIRSMTVDTVRNVSSEQQSYSESASVLEKQNIQAGGLRPIAFTFTCKPYTDLKERTFMLRISPITRGTDIYFSLKALVFEETLEEIADEFKQALAEGFKDTEVKTYMGKYNPRS